MVVVSTGVVDELGFAEFGSGAAVVEVSIEVGSADVCEEPPAQAPAIAALATIMATRRCADKTWLMAFGEYLGSKPSSSCDAAVMAEC